jgi:hypothetical protein
MKKNPTKAEQAAIGLLLPAAALLILFERGERSRRETPIADHWAVTLTRVVVTLAAL